MPERTLCIVNPASAGGRALSVWSGLQHHCPHPTTTVRFTSAPNHSFLLARDLASHHHILIAAGDRTEPAELLAFGLPGAKD